MCKSWSRKDIPFLPDILWRGLVTHFHIFSEVVSIVYFFVSRLQSMTNRRTGRSATVRSSRPASSAGLSVLVLSNEAGQCCCFGARISAGLLDVLFSAGGIRRGNLDHKISSSALEIFGQCWYWITDQCWCSGSLISACTLDHWSVLVLWSTGQCWCSGDFWSVLVLWITDQCWCSGALVSAGALEIFGQCWYSGSLISAGAL
jgi:hypothetical protein